MHSHAPPDSLAAAHAQPAGEFDGGALQASVSWAPRDWSASASYLMREKDLRLDAGFEPRSDVRSRQFSFTRRFWGDGRGWFERVALSGGLWVETELDGGLLGEGKWVGFEYDGPRQLYLRAYSNFDQTLGFHGRAFGTDSRYVQIGARPIGGLGLSVSVQHGDGVDFATARAAREVAVWSSFDVRVGRHLELRGSHAFQRLRSEGADVLRAGVAEGRAVYSFTPRSFLRATMQYRTTTRPIVASDSGAETDDRDLGIQLLYAYKVNPQTVLFLGYATRYADATAPPPGLSERSRAFFMKLGYAWRP